MSPATQVDTGVHCRRLVDPERDPGTVPDEQGEDDRALEQQDVVGDLEVRAHEPDRALAEPDGERDRHADQGAHREQVDEQGEPALLGEPRDRPVDVHRAEERHHDRRQQDEEAPEQE
jgi:hypothetical protein